MYTLEFEARARRRLRRLDGTIQRRVLSELERLCADCDARPHEALKGKDRGKFRLRVQDYRAVYSFNKGTREITVHRVDHRSRVYS